MKRFVLALSMLGVLLVAAAAQAHPGHTGGRNEYGNHHGYYGYSRPAPQLYFRPSPGDTNVYVIPPYERWDTNVYVRPHWHDTNVYVRPYGYVPHHGGHRPRIGIYFQW